MITTRARGQLKAVCQNPQEIAREDGAVYYAIRPQAEKSFGKEPNITILLPGRLGKEFYKTFGHYHLHNEPETYRFLYGSGIVLMQKRGEGGRLERVVAKEARAGQSIRVPEGFGHSLINTSDDLLITADWESETASHDYREIKAKQGMGYFVVDVNGRVGFEKNPRYHDLPKLERE